MNYLEKFQRDNGLIVDGVMGVNTLLKMKQVFNLPSIEATAHFVAQVEHESGHFKYGVENLNYSATALRRVFRKYFPTDELARVYARKPEKIANKVYANRMGNGNEKSGDGWKYRGRFSIQTTGRNNYAALSRYTGDIKILTDPDSVVDKYYWVAALYYFNIHNLYKYTDTVDYNSIRKITRAINGAYNGLSQRYELTVKYYELLKKK